MPETIVTAGKQLETKKDYVSQVYVVKNCECVLHNSAEYCVLYTYRCSWKQNLNGHRQRIKCETLASEWIS